MKMNSILHFHAEMLPKTDFSFTLSEWRNPDYMSHGPKALILLLRNERGAPSRPFSPSGSKDPPPIHLPLPRPQKMTDTAKALRILNALCGTKDSLSHTFSVPFLGKLINNVREIKGKSIWMLRRIQRAQLGFRCFFRSSGQQALYICFKRYMCLIEETSM